MIIVSYLGSFGRRPHTLDLFERYEQATRLLAVVCEPLGGVLGTQRTLLEIVKVGDVRSHTDIVLIVQLPRHQTRDRPLQSFEDFWVLGWTLKKLLGGT